MGCKTQIFIVICLFIWSISGVAAQDVQWRGPERDGRYPDKNLLKKWPDDGPQLVVGFKGAGKGYSQVVLHDDVMYVTGIKDENDVLSAFDMGGNLLWDIEYGKAWERSYPETRSTPTIENGRIYLIGGMGNVVCIDMDSRKIIWQKDVHGEFGGEYHSWGVAESVLLSDKAAFYTTGGNQTTVVALDKNNGNLLWKTESLGGARAYSSPLLVKRGNHNILLAQTSTHFLGVDADNGKILWNYDLTPLQKERHGRGAHTNTPLYSDGEIFITNGYNRDAVMFSLAEDGRSIKEKWRNNVLDVHHGGAVLHNGNIYGSTWESNGKGNWACIRWSDGRTHWNTEWHNKGSVIGADDMLYFYEEKSGNLALVKPDADKLNIVSTLQMKGGEGPHWAHPAIYNGMLFVRHGDAVNVYNVKLNN